MRFLLDESADARLALYLRSLGHDATLVAQDHQPGLPDQTVLEIARREGRVLVTDDRDFGELVIAQHLPHTGVIYLRLGTSLLATRIDRLAHVLTHHAQELDRFLVVTRTSVRAR